MTICEKVAETLKKYKGFASIDEISENLPGINISSIRSAALKFERQYVSGSKSKRSRVIVILNTDNLFKIDLSKHPRVCRQRNSVVYQEICQKYCKNYDSCKRLFDDIAGKKVPEEKYIQDKLNKWYQRKMEKII